MVPGSALKVCVGGWVVLKVNLVIDFCYSLALASAEQKSLLECSTLNPWGKQQYLLPTDVRTCQTHAGVQCKKMLWE